MCANPQSNRLNTIAVRASYILPIWSDFLGENQEKPGGGLSPPGKNQNRNQFVFLSFGVDPLNWQSFIEIDEMACSMTARCSRGHALNLDPNNSTKLIQEFDIINLKNFKWGAEKLWNMHSWINNQTSDREIFLWQKHCLQFRNLRYWNKHVW